MEQLDLFGGAEAITTPAAPAPRRRAARGTQYTLFAVDAAVRDDDKAADEQFVGIFNLTAGAML
jgi:hypothetical protein